MNEYHEKFEEAVIGCIMLAPETLDSISGQLSSGDFADDQLGGLFAPVSYTHLTLPTKA